MQKEAFVSGVYIQARAILTRFLCLNINCARTESCLVISIMEETWQNELSIATHLKKGQLTIVGAFAPEAGIRMVWPSSVSSIMNIWSSSTTSGVAWPNRLKLPN